MALRTFSGRNAVAEDKEKRRHLTSGRYQARRHICHGHRKTNTLLYKNTLCIEDKPKVATDKSELRNTRRFQMRRSLAFAVVNSEI